MVKAVADLSFNQVTVDGDSSTNDTFLMLANGAAGNAPVSSGSPEADLLRAALLEVAQRLARSIARDGEGATKLLTVRVAGAASGDDARLAARTVASSSLVKTAFHGQIVVIKVGGNAIDKAKDQTLLDVVLLRYVGMQPVLVHGGGPEITAMSERLGLTAEFKNGLRITDDKTMEVVKMVLTGKVSPDLVASLNRMGGQAVGMSGEDGPSIIAEPLSPDMGFVGKVVQVNVEPITALLGRGYVPVIASIGLGYDGPAYNINPATVPAEIPVALGAAKLNLLTDVPAVQGAGGGGAAA